MSESIRFEIDGMGCGSCVAKVKAALSKVPGLEVEAVATGSARVRRDPAQVPDEAVVRALAAAGYSARPERKEASDDRAACCAPGGACAVDAR